MATWKRFEDMESWKYGCQLTCDVFRITGEGKMTKQFALRDQICRSALSIPSNIAEGFERDSSKAFANSLTIAKGSSGELRTQIYIALKLGYIEREAALDLVARAKRISKMIAGLIAYLRKQG